MFIKKEVYVGILFIYLFLAWTVFPQKDFTTEIGQFGSNIRKVYIWFFCLCFNLYVFKDNKRKTMVH